MVANHRQSGAGGAGHDPPHAGVVARAAEIRMNHSISCPTGSPAKPSEKEKAAVSGTATNTQYTWNGPLSHRKPPLTVVPRRRT